MLILILIIHIIIGKSLLYFVKRFAKYEENFWYKTLLCITVLIVPFIFIIMPTKPDRQDIFKENIDFVENFLIKNNIAFDKREYGVTEVVFKYQGFNVWKLCAINIHDEAHEIDQKIRNIKNNVAH